MIQRVRQNSPVQYDNINEKPTFSNRIKYRQVQMNPVIIESIWEVWCWKQGKTSVTFRWNICISGLARLLTVLIFVPEMLVALDFSFSFSHSPKVTFESLIGQILSCFPSLLGIHGEMVKEIFGRCLSKFPCLLSPGKWLVGSRER